MARPGTHDFTPKPRAGEYWLLEETSRGAALGRRNGYETEKSNTVSADHVPGPVLAAEALAVNKM